MKPFSLIFIILFFIYGQNSFAQLKKVNSSEQNSIQTLYLAGGCFWGMQDLLRKFKGVISTEVGYMGDKALTVNYDLVKNGKTKFAETVKVDFDIKKTSVEEVLKYFFKIHDPTTLNRQGNDVGSQYRSVIFYTTENQKIIAQSLFKMIEAKKIFKSQLTTQLLEAGRWYKAEEIHQDYLLKNPNGYTCHFERKINF